MAHTDAETVREALAAQLVRVIPRYAPQRAERWTWQRDQEICGTIRNFDVVLEPEAEVIRGAYGDGLEYAADTAIVVSYPVSEPDLARYAGADGQDLAAVLIRLHTSVPGMQPVSMRGLLPVSERILDGSPGAYVVTFRASLHFMVSDLVAQEATS